MQYSFYGGQQGKNFQISEIFSSKVAMMQDLMRRYQSPIGVGELVFISYGMQTTANESPYQIHSDLDLQAYKHTYNSTLWQKIYTEEDNKETDKLTGLELEYVSGDFGIGYKMIASLVGTTPIFKISNETLHANEDPLVDIDNTNVDRPVLIFKLPRAQVLKLLDTIKLDADQDPALRLDNSDIDHPGLELSLPQAQQLLPEHVTTTVLNADEKPEIVFDVTGNNADGTKKINRPSMEIKLPQSQVWGLGKVTTLDADKIPTVDIDKSDINNPKLDLGLPRSQVLQLNPTIVLAPLEDPDMEYDETNINAPELTFSLPRAVRFMYGNRLGKRNPKTQIVTLASAPEIAELRPGDYYVHEGTGFIYMVTAEDPVSRTFEYKACLAAPVPTINKSTVDPYELVDGKYQVKGPEIEKSWADPIEQIGLVLGFKIPRLPDLKGQIEFCGPDEDGSIEGEPTGTKEFTYSFVIPSGARFFCGSEVDSDNLNAVIPDARPGDFYINGNWYSEDNGNVYKMDIKKHWVYNGNIKGDPGDPLNIIDSFTITSDEVEHDTLQEVSDYLETTLLNGQKPKENEIIAITYEAKDGDSITSVAYWYYVVKGQWQRAQLTGSMKNFIENDYVESPEDDPVTNKTYSIDYINKLIGGTLTEDNKDKTTFSKDQLIALFSWHSFQEAEDGSWWPEIGVDKDTMSAEEILGLLAWENMGKLV